MKVGPIIQGGGGIPKIEKKEKTYPVLPYIGRRKQVTKIKFLVKEQNVSVISTDCTDYQTHLLAR